MGVDGFFRHESQARRQPFGRGLALKRHGEALDVVVLLPSPEGSLGLVVARQIPPAPEFFVVDPVAPLDLAVPAEDGADGCSDTESLPLRPSA